MVENWKSICGFEGKYMVSDRGRIKSLIRNKILKPQEAGGYFQVYFSVGGKQKWFKVHRLVAEAFIPNPGDLPVINHKDCDKHNNCVENLEWCTSSYNTQHYLSTKTTVYERLGLTKEEYERQWHREYDRVHYNKEKAHQYYLQNREKILKRVKEYQKKFN